MERLNRISKSAVMAASISLICCATAVAADRGFYVSVGAGVSTFESQSSYSYSDFVGGYTGTRSWHDDSSIGWSSAVGYRFLRQLAVEVSYEDYGDAGFTDMEREANKFGGRIDRTTLGSASAKGFSTSVIAGIEHNGLELFARIGVVRAQVDWVGSTTAVITPVSGFPNSGPLQPTVGNFRESGQNTKLRFGFGGGYTFRQRFHVRADLQMIRGVGGIETDRFGGVDLTTLGLSLQYRF